MLNLSCKKKKKNEASITWLQDLQYRAQVGVDRVFICVFHKSVLYGRVARTKTL